MRVRHPPTCFAQEQDTVSLVKLCEHEVLELESNKVNIGPHISYMKQIKPYSNVAQLMPHLNVELSKAEERYMNQLGSAV